MRTWARRNTIVKENDYLYRNILRHMWAKIQSYPKDICQELTIRLWEECMESVGMCAQGHISRLINVFSGFDDQYKVTTSSLEQFQDQMASIHTMDISNTEKKAKAIQLMESLQMPEEDREVWLDALE